MSQIVSSTLSERSRLVNRLTALSAVRLSAADYNLAERMGHLVGLSDSISLVRSLRQLPQVAGLGTTNDADLVREEVLKSRGQMLRVITLSFTIEAHDARIQAPIISGASISGAIKEQALLTFDPYRRFYVAHQAEMTANVQSLRDQVRKAIAGFSVELHQLAQLDRLLDDSMAHTRKLFNVTPKLLEPRFKQLLEEYQANNSGDINVDSWTQPGAWLELFYRDMCDLLLAELDVRLQPVFGLLEALYE